MFAVFILCVYTCIFLIAFTIFFLLSLNSLKLVHATKSRLKVLHVKVGMGARIKFNHTLVVHVACKAMNTDMGLGLTTA